MPVKVKARAAKKTALKLKSKSNVKPKLTKTALKPGKEIYVPTKKKVTPLHVAIAGNIGAGKTTLTNLLAKNMKWEPHFETVDDNPYLNDFYEDMQRWSFNLQIYFLNSRFQQVMNIRQSPKTIIQDRTIYEDAYIFAPNLHAMGLMTTRDFNNYQVLFESMAKFLTPPDLLIYLRASVPALVNQIQKRGREYENTIRIDYLKRLNERYEAWISSYDLGKILIIDIDAVNFAENPEELGTVINRINAELHGLF
jgi:deoxyadenosine/deoxycytidine kinase